jgi:hypothetical protein
MIFQGTLGTQVSFRQLSQRARRPLIDIVLLGRRFQSAQQDGARDRGRTKPGYFPCSWPEELYRFWFWFWS